MNGAEFLSTPGQKILIQARGEFYALFTEDSGLAMCLTPLPDHIMGAVTETGAEAWSKIHPWALEREGDRGTHMWAVALRDAPKVAVGRMSWTYKGTNLLTEHAAVLTEEQEAVIGHLGGMAAEVWPDIWTGAIEPPETSGLPRVIFSQFGPATPPAEA